MLQLQRLKISTSVFFSLPSCRSEIARSQVLCMGIVLLFAPSARTPPLLGANLQMLQTRNFSAMAWHTCVATYACAATCMPARARTSGIACMHGRTAVRAVLLLNLDLITYYIQVRARTASWYEARGGTYRDPWQCHDEYCARRTYPGTYTPLALARASVRLSIQFLQAGDVT